MPQKKKLMCRVFGHDIRDQPIRPVGSTMGRKMRDELGNPLDWPVAYHMRICKRCGRYQPVTAEDAELQREISEKINAVMNQSRAKYGMGWLDFSPGP